MAVGISLANKCQLLFGAAVVLIILVALSVPWFRDIALIDQSQFETSRQIARLWAENTVLEPKLEWLLGPRDVGREETGTDLSLRYWAPNEWDTATFESGFLAAARRQLNESSKSSREYREALWDRGDRVYRYARVIEDPAGNDLGVVVVERRSATASSQLLVNRLYLIVAALIAGSLAVLVFYLITMKIILSPVRSLRDTATLVREGNLHIRSEIATGDEFEQLSDAFNSMLEDLAVQQAQLRGVNRSLDLKLTELAQQNMALFEAARLKGEFLANVSHELRTPLNSIIGFAEILLDIAERQPEPELNSPESAALAKRKRYLENIASAGRNLLVMINELLEMAKIEAGRTELHVQPMNVAETCEGLMALIKPLADKKQINLSLQLASGSGAGWVTDAADSDLPPIETDQQKFQQIVFNFLSNAVKFTPEEGGVTLRAERLAGADGQVRVRVSVLDTGPGIPPERHAFIFEKFSQLDGGHTREHQGTGLGLAIAKEFAELLDGELQLVSDVGRGSMFSLIVPLKISAAKRIRTSAQIDMVADDHTDTGTEAAHRPAFIVTQPARSAE